MKIKKNISRQPRKKRKELFNAPLHAKAKLVRAHLSKELREKLKRRSERLKKGDKVKIIRGRFKGRSGKVVKVSLSRGKIFVEGIVQKKQSGKEESHPINASNVVILEMEKREARKAEEKK
ncbi:50S ribosomal protein L24 [Candidatus Micrarchaeota archaeon]|nr:50S ribosomal protein L24 [Candidatus Micrarchaeota archaeon]